MEMFRVYLRKACDGFMNKYAERRSVVAIMPGEGTGKFECYTHNGKLEATPTDDSGKSLVSCSGCVLFYPKGFTKEVRSEKT